MMKSYDNSFRDSAVLVTGGAGFIGSHLAERLLDFAGEVRVIDDLSSGRRANVPDGAVFTEASILDDTALRAAMEGCRFVFHEAAMVSVPLSVERPGDCLRINIEGTERVLEAARDLGVERVVFAASAAAYGESPRLPSTESDPIDCCSPYAASKVAGEALMRAFAHCYGLSTVSLRYFNIFGPRQDPNSPYAAVISAFASALERGESPTIFGDGMQTRDFTAVDNVVHANLLAASLTRPLAGEVINIGTGERTSLMEVLAAMTDLRGQNVTPQFAPPRPGDVPHSQADIHLAAELLGYRPIAGFREGLRDLLRGRRMNAELRSQT